MTAPGVPISRPVPLSDAQHSAYYPPQPYGAHVSGSNPHGHGRGASAPEEHYVGNVAWGMTLFGLICPPLWIAVISMPMCCTRSRRARKAAVVSAVLLFVYILAAIIIVPSMVVARRNRGGI